MSNTIALYPLSNFTFSTKEAQPEEDPSVSARLQRLQNNYEDFGMRRTVEGILVVHDHGHPHILMLQIANAFFKLRNRRLKKRLDDRLAPPSNSQQFDQNHGIDNDWEIGTAWRKCTPSSLHISPSPRSAKSSSSCRCPNEVLAVPKNMKLLAIPLFELYDNAARYGPN
ncbi:hypothetical protein FA13DRAFT_1782691 [Coprinellus micaceus]|uniref:Cleavage and polyadenylation specificity factor subunit 5 n=1 Tax=Coprinellus micaceus TaxID=71717 RepID=A0A4Y7RYC7_COPMI|nr:hypothetical protein FA13DRAFT_1782691 [Coprinellus micaceus]